MVHRRSHSLVNEVSTETNDMGVRAGQAIRRCFFFLFFLGCQEELSAGLFMTTLEKCGFKRSACSSPALGRQLFDETKTKRAFVGVLI